MSVDRLDTLAEDLPRWDLDAIFPGPGSPEYRAALNGIAAQTAQLEPLFDRLGVGEPLAVGGVEEVIVASHALLDRAAVVGGYLFCLTADVRDEAAQAAASEWRLPEARLGALAPRFVAWVGTLDKAHLLGTMVRV